MELFKSEQYIKEHRAETIEKMCVFAQTDLLMFWSDNPDVYAIERKIWQPFIDLLQNEIKESFNISNSLQVPNNDKCILKLKEKLQAFTDKELTVAFLTALQTKSVILGMSLLNRNITTDKIFEAAFLEDIYQNKQWGVDEEALQKREQTKYELQKLKEYLKK